LIVAAADANGDSVVDFDEWFAKLKSYVTAAFDALDENEDGSILDESKDGNILTSISYRFFEELLNQLFDFFDSNKDGAISLEDDIFLGIFRGDRNGDGKTTLSEAIGTNLISLPAPIYNFYNKLDRDTDERLTKAEALDFVSKLFTLINTDSDCKIDVNEVLQLLNELEVPWDQQLAVKMLLNQELSLVSYLLKNLVERADKDGDGEVTIEEILNFSDFEFIESAFHAVLELAEPGNSLGYLMSPGCGGGCGREEREALVAMWFTALQNLMEKPIFYSAGEATHSCTNAE